MYTLIWLKSNIYLDRVNYLKLHKFPRSDGKINKVDKYEID